MTHIDIRISRCAAGKTYDQFNTPYVRTWDWRVGYLVSEALWGCFVVDKFVWFVFNIDGEICNVDAAVSHLVVILWTKPPSDRLKVTFLVHFQHKSFNHSKKERELPTLKTIYQHKKFSHDYYVRSLTIFSTIWCVAFWSLPEYSSVAILTSPSS